MSTYIALLRGINVSGQKKIKMAELRQHLSALGFEQVQTYIQSGNVVFQCPAQATANLAKAIQDKIQLVYGWQVPTTVLEPGTLQQVLAHNPYLNEHGADPKHLYVTFLQQPPAAEQLATLETLKAGQEQFMLYQHWLYLYLPHGAGRTKLDNNTLERKLNTQATTRNWKTCQTLWQMSQQGT